MIIVVVVVDVVVAVDNKHQQGSTVLLFKWSSDLRLFLRFLLCRFNVFMLLVLWALQACYAFSCVVLCVRLAFCAYAFYVFMCSRV